VDVGDGSLFVGTFTETYDIYIAISEASSHYHFVRNQLSSIGAQ